MHVILNIIIACLHCVGFGMKIAVLYNFILYSICIQKFLNTIYSFALREIWNKTKASNCPPPSRRKAGESLFEEKLGHVRLSVKFPWFPDCKMRDSDLIVGALHQERTATEEPPCNGQKDNYRMEGGKRGRGMGMGLKSFLFERTPTLNSDAAPNYNSTRVCCVRIRVLNLICETSQWNTYNQKHCDETKPRTQWRFEAKTQENHKQDHDWPNPKQW